MGSCWEWRIMELDGGVDLRMSFEIIIDEQSGTNTELEYRSDIQSEQDRWLSFGKCERGRMRVERVVRKRCVSVRSGIDGRSQIDRCIEPSSSDRISRHYKVVINRWLEVKSENKVNSKNSKVWYRLNSNPEFGWLAWRFELGRCSQFDVHIGNDMTIQWGSNVCSIETDGCNLSNRVDVTIWAVETQRRLTTMRTVRFQEVWTIHSIATCVVDIDGR